MRKVQILGISLCVVFVFSTVAAASAFAEHEYLISGEVLKAANLNKATVTGVSELLSEDMKGGIFGEAVDFLCSFEFLGEFLAANDFEIISIFPLGGTDPGTGATSIKCETMAGTCGESEIKAVNLPWLVEVVLVGTAFRGLLQTGGAGSPGSNVTCSKIVEDTCTIETSVGLANTGTGVTAAFDALSEAGGCTRGGAREWLIEGTFTLTNSAGILAIS